MPRPRPSGPVTITTPCCWNPSAPAVRRMSCCVPRRGGCARVARWCCSTSRRATGGRTALTPVGSPPKAGPRPPPAETAISAALEGAGFAINVVEDAAPRHRRAVIESWQALILAMRAQAERPSPQAAATLIAEAEAWLLRLRLLADGRLRLLRWHASMARRLG